MGSCFGKVLPEIFAAAPDKKLKSDLIRLFTTSYRESNAGRAAEYLQCLRNNLQHTLITEVCVLDENCGWLPTHDRIRVRTVKSRPTYADFFQWINQLCTPQDISIIANSDIYFDETLSLLTRGLRRTPAPHCPAGMCCPPGPASCSIAMTVRMSGHFWDRSAP